MEEVLPEGRNFRLVDESELPEILEILGNFLPDSIKFHQTLKTYLDDRVWDFHFYISKTWPEQPIILHFPGMTRTLNYKIYESLSVFCPCDQLELLELLETEDILIDWTQPIYMNFTHAKIMQKIEEFYASRGKMEKLYGDVYVLSEKSDQEESESTETVLAESAEMSQLKPEHAQAIHDLYPANHMECVEVFEKLIERLPCYGIFAPSGDLAAWMVQSYYGAMFSMQTKPEYRRKGYGIVLAKHLTKLVTQRGYLPFVVIRPENDASKGLYSKLGFRKHFETVRAILRPHELTSDAQGGGTNDDKKEPVGDSVAEHIEPVVVAVAEESEPIVEGMREESEPIVEEAREESEPIMEGIREESEPIVEGVAKEETVSKEETENSPQDEEAQ